MQNKCLSMTYKFCLGSHTCPQCFGVFLAHQAHPSWSVPFICAFFFWYSVSQSFSSNLGISSLRTILSKSISQFLLWIWHLSLSWCLSQSTVIAWCLFLPLIHKFSELKDCIFHSSILRAEHSTGYTVDIELVFSSLSYFLVHETNL